MNSKVVFGQYYHADSWIHRLDPRTKLLSLMLLMISLFMINNLIFLGCLLVCVLLLILSSKVPFGRFINSLKMMIMLLLFTTFFQIIFNTSGDKLCTFEFTLTFLNLGIIIAILAVYVLLGKVVKKYRVIQLLLALFLCFYIQTIVQTGGKIVDYSISIYDQGLFSSLRIILRIISLILLSSLLTLTTKPTDLNNGLEKLLSFLYKLKINVGIFTMMISIALRFIPTLINEADKILKAQASRGVDFKEGKMKEKIMQIVSLLIPMFVISYKKADDLASAMEARGYDPNQKRTSINVLHFRFIDGFVLSLSVVILITFIFLRVRYAL